MFAKSLSVFHLFPFHVFLWLLTDPWNKWNLSRFYSLCFSNCTPCVDKESYTVHNINNSAVSLYLIYCPYKTKWKILRCVEVISFLSNWFSSVSVIFLEPVTISKADKTHCSTGFKIMPPDSKEILLRTRNSITPNHWQNFSLCGDYYGYLFIYFAMHPPDLSLTRFLFAGLKSATATTSVCSAWKSRMKGRIPAHQRTVWARRRLQPCCRCTVRSTSCILYTNSHTHIYTLTHLDMHKKALNSGPFSRIR